jgi:hypothetical protein
MVTLVQTFRRAVLEVAKILREILNLPGLWRGSVLDSIREFISLWPNSLSKFSGKTVFELSESTSPLQGNGSALATAR